MLKKKCVAWAAFREKAPTDLAICAAQRRIEAAACDVMEGGLSVV